MVKTTPSRANGRSIGQRAHIAGDLCHITAGDVSRGLVADAELETSRTPIDELDGLPGLEGGDSSINVLSSNIATKEQNTSHCFEMNT